MAELPPDRPELSDALPKLYIHCDNVYRAMVKTARLPESDGSIVWEGHLTKFMEEQLGYSVSRYSRIVKTLTEMGCIEQKRRGSGRNNPSEWFLIGEPTLEAFEYYKQREGKKAYKVDVVKQHINDLKHTVLLLQTRLDVVETKLGLVKEEKRL
jgi:hypothetical protein